MFIDDNNTQHQMAVASGSSRVQPTGSLTDVEPDHMLGMSRFRLDILLTSIYSNLAILYSG